MHIFLGQQQTLAFITVFFCQTQKLLHDRTYILYTNDKTVVNTILYKLCKPTKETAQLHKVIFEILRLPFKRFSYKGKCRIILHPDLYSRSIRDCFVLSGMLDCFVLLR